MASGVTRDMPLASSTISHEGSIFGRHDVSAVASTFVATGAGVRDGWSGAGWRGTKGDSRGKKAIPRSLFKVLLIWSIADVQNTILTIVAEHFPLRKSSYAVNCKSFAV
ncbi:hypothetical protein FPV67DRAFT_1450198 [Lyophyllum atratum]|nr:hypothetical protein FPV67DRAFT_1450198 [Lyophyllum atratum]